MKCFFEWTENEWCELLPHIPLRWLTLFPPIHSKLLKGKIYFMRKDRNSSILRIPFKDEQDTAYLGFVIDAFTVFQVALKSYKITQEYDSFLYLTCGFERFCCCPTFVSPDIFCTQGRYSSSRFNFHISTAFYPLRPSSCSPLLIQS